MNTDVCMHRYVWCTYVGLNVRMYVQMYACQYVYVHMYVTITTGGGHSCQRHSL